MNRLWTAADLREIEHRWRTETLREIADDIGIPLGTMKSLLSRHNIKCPAKNPKGRRRTFGPVSQSERDSRRRWYRMYRSMRASGMPAQDAVRRLKKQGCTLSRHQLTCGWLHYKKSHLEK